MLSPENDIGVDDDPIFPSLAIDELQLFDLRWFSPLRLRLRLPQSDTIREEAREDYHLDSLEEIQIPDCVY